MFILNKKLKRLIHPSGRVVSGQPGWRIVHLAHIVYSQTSSIGLAMSDDFDERMDFSGTDL